MFGDQIDVTGGAQRSDWIFLRISVEIADDELIALPGRGRISAQPLSQCLRCPLAGKVAIALAVVSIRIAEIGARAAFGFEVVDRDRQPFAVGALLKGLR